MKNRDLVVLVLLAAGVWLVAFRRDASGRTLIDSLTGPAPLEARPVPLATVPTTLEDVPTVTSQNASQRLIGVSAGVAAAVLPGVLAGGGGAATAGGGAAAGASAAGGISTAAALTAAGVAAGAAVLAWAIIKKGLFRGGEEALKVNPARDAWFDTFVQHYFPGGGSSYQFQAYVRAAGDAGIPGNEAEGLLAAIYAADTVREWQIAADNAAATFTRYASLAA